MGAATIGSAMHRRGGACAGVNGDRRHGVAGGGEGFVTLEWRGFSFFFFELGGESFLSHKEFRRKRFAGANHV